MPTYLGWNVITIPAYPPAPASFEVNEMNIIGLSTSPFTGQQQVYDWNAEWTEASVTMPAMPFDVAQPWVTFLKDLKGAKCVFQFSTSFGAAYPEIGTRYWRLKSNARRWSVTRDRVYSIQFDIREAF